MTGLLDQVVMQKGQAITQDYAIAIRRSEMNSEEIGQVSKRADCLMHPVGDLLADLSTLARAADQQTYSPANDRTYNANNLITNLDCLLKLVLAVRRAEVGEDVSNH